MVLRKRCYLSTNYTRPQALSIGSAFGSVQSVETAGVIALYNVGMHVINDDVVTKAFNYPNIQGLTCVD